MVFPELVLTGYTCGELFIQKSLLAKAKEELRKLIAFTAGDSMLVFVGLPWEYNNKLYNVAAAIQDGKLLGLVPKRWIPNYSEFYEGRYFNPGWEKTIDVSWDGYQVPMGMKLLFSCDNVEKSRRGGGDLRGRLGFKSTEYCTRVGGGNGDRQLFCQR